MCNKPTVRSLRDASEALHSIGESLGITSLTAEGLILHQLATDGPMTSEILRERTNMKTSRFLGATGRLIRAGMLRRVIDPRDLRKRIYSIAKVI